jgi:hypothetical protein
MQSLLKVLLPSNSGSLSYDVSDSRGFDLADRLEDGESHEVLADWFRPMKNQGMYLLRKGHSLNEWIMVDYRSMGFIMRSVVELESSGVFSADFDPKIAAMRPDSGRVRIAVYLYQQGDPLPGGPDPVVVMLSDFKRQSWKTFKVICDCCRYQRRRSSLTEGIDELKREELQGRSPKAHGLSSACSFHSPSHIDDFSGLCDVVPSSQEVMRMHHYCLQVHGKDFTKIKLKVPSDRVGWCPISRPTRKVLEDKNACTSEPESAVESKLPVWSEALKALALEFRHREVLPSRRNFQLICPPSNETICQFYRTGKNEYMLELKASSDSKLSLVQAFCIALSSTLWR